MIGIKNAGESSPAALFVFTRTTPAVLASAGEQGLGAGARAGCSERDRGSECHRARWPCDSDHRCRGVPPYAGQGRG